MYTYLDKAKAKASGVVESSQLRLIYGSLVAVISSKVVKLLVSVHIYVYVYVYVYLGISNCKEPLVDDTCANQKLRNLERPFEPYKGHTAWLSKNQFKLQNALRKRTPSESWKAACFCAMRSVLWFGVHVFTV